MGFKLMPEVFWGPGSLNDLEGVLKQAGAKYVLVVTDKGIVKSGIADRVVSTAKKGCDRTEVFDGVQPDP